VLNLLSEGIVNADGSPGPNFAKGQPIPDHVRRLTAANSSAARAAPISSFTQRCRRRISPARLARFPPAIGILTLPGGDLGLAPQDQFLFGTGGSGLERHPRSPIPASPTSTNLPPGPFQLTGPDHALRRLPLATPSINISKWFSRSDCANRCRTRVEGQPDRFVSTISNPRFTTTFSTPPGGTPAMTPVKTMAFFNVQNGDAPLFKSLADTYTMSDNYHQPRPRRDPAQTASRSLCRSDLFQRR